jgi:HAD superfamily hydrolase (TIGR01509 family)
VTSVSRSAQRLPTEIPEAIVFDLDGVMIDSERIDRLGWRDVAARQGLVVSDEFYARSVGRREVDIAAEFHAAFGQDFADFARQVGDWRRHYIDTQGMPQKPGLGALLDTLDGAGIRYAMATSTTRADALERMGELPARLAAAAFGNEVAAGKPAPDIYLLAAQRLGVAPARCLAIEDSLPGVVAAERAGMTVIMVPDLVAPHDAIRFVCDSLADVQRWLQNMLDPAG